MPRKADRMPKPKKPEPRAKGRKKETRENILKAALAVFSSYPYHGASIRMIGKLAGIEHPLISYYFPAKADLFRAVISELVEYHFKTETEQFREIKKMEPAEGFSMYLDHILEDFQERPGLLKIVALNVTQPDDTEPIPGYDQIQGFLHLMSRSFVETIGLQASLKEGEMFARATSTMLISFLGASNSFAAMLDMQPNSIQYYNWVKDTLIYTLLPRLEKIVRRKSTAKPATD